VVLGWLELSFARSLINDTLDKNFVIKGGVGDDIIDMGRGLTAADTIDGKGGSNTLQVERGAVNTTDTKLINIQTVVLKNACDLDLSKQTENFTIRGSSSSDNIISGSGNDTIDAGGGNDSIKAGGGSDNITTGSGADIVEFEAAYATNVIDTVTDFQYGYDKLDFSLFLTSAVNTTGTEIPNTTAADLAAGLNLTGFNVGAVYGADNGEISKINIGTTVAAGKITMADNTKAVVLSKQSDSSATCYIYFIEDTNAAIAAQTWSVKLVGVLENNSAYTAADMADSANFF
jgi:Ca2+-binding RTX toxin-like protein